MNAWTDREPDADHVPSWLLAGAAVGTFLLGLAGIVVAARRWLG